ncbi:MAG: DUF4040 domain-containing protein [Anaerolineales bacterium]|nr:DUF4040 domain-containing protein [Anaerolineales bacterium]MCB8950457.1 DUF4040 domain-containing protein [Ardenticatenales bacterium]
MADNALLLPLLLIIFAAGGAALAALPPLNRRLPPLGLGFGLSLFPLAAFLLLLQLLVRLGDGVALTWSVAWLPTLNLNLSLRLDALSGLFALLVTGIGALVLVYSGHYFRADRGAWRFLTYILLFMTAMLGLVLAGDVLSLFIFWEGTSVTSFLLVAYKYKDEAARRGAFKALFITGGGGVALLVGLLFVAHYAGSTDLTTILNQGDALRTSPLYPVMLGLIAFAAITKSAQVPAHIWLPDAMSAPTPASAYLHSATMVKAGIYLMARLNPVLGGTETWFWLLSLFGLLTMLTGAYLGLKQNDLKALLAYSTISQLGVLMLLIGQDTEIAFKALVIGVLAHALYKSALFLLVGIVDQYAGTRDPRRLGGLARAMPAVAVVTTVAALSLAGLPPLFGFLAKETLLAAAVHPSLPPLLAWVFPAAAVIAGALLLAQAGLLVWDTFFHAPSAARPPIRPVPWGMVIVPMLPAFLSLAIGILPEPAALASLLARAASTAYGDKVKVSLALWTGLNIPLALSAVAILLGTGLFLRRHAVRAWQMRWLPALTANTLYHATLRLLDRLGEIAARLQQGRLRFYLAVIIAAMLAIVAWLGGGQVLTTWPATQPPTLDSLGVLAGLRLFALAAVVGAALASVFLRRDLFAILALGVSGFGVAVLMALEPAPDVALVQIVVDILTTVILVLALTRLPRTQRRRAQDLTFRQSRAGLVRDALVALGGGALVSLITLNALLTRPRVSAVSPYYIANAKPLTGAKDIVGAIVVDFRALDTLIEITVFALAGMGIYTLLRYAARRFGDEGRQVMELPPPTEGRLPAFGIGGAHPSALLRLLGNVSLPLALILAATHMMYGHDQPGDGFTAGILISLAAGFWYIIFGYEETRRRLPWLRAFPLIGGGILLALVTGGLAALLTGHFLGNFDLGKMLGLPLPAGFYFSSSFLLEVAICLAVLGGATHMLNTLGHPGHKDAESARDLAHMDEQPQTDHDSRKGA